MVDDKQESFFFRSVRRGFILKYFYIFLIFKIIHYNFEIRDCGVKCKLEDLFLGVAKKDITPVQNLIQALGELEKQGCNLITAEQSNIIS